MERRKTIFMTLHAQQSQTDKLSPEKKEKEKLQSLIDKPQKPLLVISTVFPFDFFPDTLVIETIKVHLISRHFFASEQIHSFLVKGIADVFVETGPIFATLNILLQMVTRENQQTQIKNLWKHDAVKARDIIQGLIIASRENI